MEKNGWKNCFGFYAKYAGSHRHNGDRCKSPEMAEGLRNVQADKEEGGHGDGHGIFKRFVCVARGRHETGLYNATKQAFFANAGHDGKIGCGIAR